MIDRRVLGLTPGQAELISDTQGESEGKSYHTICCVGGVGSGKTRGMSIKAMHLALANAPVPVVYAMPTVPMLEDVAIPEMLNLLDECGYVSAEDYVYERRRKLITLFLEDGRRATIRYRQTSDPRAIVGGNVAAVLVDEVEDVPEDSIKEIKKRIRHPQAKLRQLVLGGTPESLGGVFYREVCEPDPDTHVIRMPTRSNHFLPKGYVDGLARALSESERDLYLEGKFVARRGRIYTQFRREAHVVECGDMLSGEQIMACDFGRGCMAWAFGVVTNDDTLHIHGELVLEGSDTFDAAKRAVRYWRDLFRAHGIDYDDEKAASMVSVYCDPAGGSLMKGSASDVRILREHGFRVFHHQRHPRVKDRINAVNEMLARGALLIDGERAPYMASCIEQHCYDDRGLPMKGRPREGKRAKDHGADAIGYAVEYRWPASSVGPQVRGVH